MWIMYSGFLDKQQKFVNMATNPRYAKFHGHTDPIKVIVKVDPDGEYYGWLPDGEEPVMIQPHIGMYEMQFPYGAEAHEKAHNGRNVMLSVERADAEH